MKEVIKAFLVVVLGLMAALTLAQMVTRYCHASPHPPKKVTVQKYPAIEDDGTAEDVPPGPSGEEVLEDRPTDEEMGRLSRQLQRHLDLKHIQDVDTE